ncbi:MAG TPA: C25 family cysteine peptidase, partial [Fibrobacteria bacterium]|nr:C25 family cysteine peptidase [Fibrobacteria bacterium]
SFHGSASGARALAKGARRAVSGSALGDSLIRIRVGDRNLENLDEDRVYALTFADIVAKAPTWQAIPVRNLRLYAGPNDTLSRAILSSRPVPGNLEEVPIEVRDADADNIFDAGDSIRFFGHGTSLWKRLPGAGGPVRFGFVSDPYSYENYYYLDGSGKGPGAALRLAESPSPAPASPPQTSVYHYLRAEKDAKSVACERGNGAGHEDSATGFLWFWHWNGSCREGRKAVTLTRSQLASAETETLRDAARGDGAADTAYLGIFAYPYAAQDDFRIWLGGARDPLAHADVPGALGNWYATGESLPPDGRLLIDSVRWGGRDGKFEGYTVVYRRRLILADAPLWIFPAAFGSRVTYRVQGGAGSACLRIEAGVPARKTILDGNGDFTDSLSPDADARYLVYRQVSAPVKGAVELELPAPPGRAIRDLETGDGENPEYLIIAPRALAEQAAVLKAYRNHGKRAFKAKTSLVLAEDIYRQYSGGRMSPPAIRDFLRWAYSEWGGRGAGANPLKYVVLFGDGDYDYRNIAVSASRDPAVRIPPYEYLIDGNDFSEGLASEDFYALLDSGDRVGDKSLLELSLGRIPAKNAAEAEAYLKKVAEYEDPAKAGAWRGRAVFAADDGTQRGATHDLDPIDQGHTTDSDGLLKIIEGNEAGVTSDRVYLLDYRMNSAYFKPEATQDLLAFINQGTLLVNYVGHGAHNQWADEALLQSNKALARMQNAGRTPIINAFSCTVGRFEDLRNEGMSEQFVMAKDRGAIAAVSALRESYPTENIQLASAFYRRAFPPDSSTAPVTIGDALREAKNSPEVSADFRNPSRYALLGEPVLLLRKPPLSVSFVRAPDTLKALDCDTIRGRIEGGSGSGFVNLSILAGSVPKKWPPPFKNALMDTQYAEQRGAILFERTLAYRDHRFATDYFIPKKIAFGDTNARILAFAWDASEEREGGSAKTHLSIRGQAQGRCAVDSDGKGPVIRITGCDPKETGAVDFPDQIKLSLPNCLEIEVTDSSGGVLSAEGPDEGTTLEVAGTLDPFHPHPGIDELYRKVYRFPLDRSLIPPGRRVLKVSSRDGYGNYTARLLRMDLTLDSSLNTVSAYNFPNPMKRNGTTFHFSTVLPSPEVDFGDPSAGGNRLEFGIRIYNQSGLLVKAFERAVSGSTSWDGRDAWGNLQANGVYFYQVTARQILSDPGAYPDYRTLSSKRNILVISR